MEFIKFLLSLGFAVIAVLVVIALISGSSIYWTDSSSGQKCSYLGFWMNSWARRDKLILYQDCGTTGFNSLVN